jgi:hypothetical protein
VPCYCYSVSPASAVSQQACGGVASGAACQTHAQSNTRENEHKAGSGRFELASYEREDLAETRDENDEGVESMARPGLATKRKRILPNGLPDPTDFHNEFGNIPNLHALRSRDGLYVEYITGEREFYRLTEDPDEIDNIASSPKVQNEVSAKHLDLNRLKNAGKN